MLSKFLQRAPYVFAVFLVFLLALLLWSRHARAVQAQATSKTQDLDWRHYGNNLENDRCQAVDQINPSNVKNLQVAWIFHTPSDTRSMDGSSL